MRAGTVGIAPREFEYHDQGGRLCPPHYYVTTTPLGFSDMPTALPDTMNTNVQK